MGWIIALLCLLPFISMKWTVILINSVCTMYIMYCLFTLTFSIYFFIALIVLFLGGVIIDYVVGNVI